MKKDPYNQKQKFEKWFDSVEKNPQVEGLNNKHSKLVISLIKDFRLGMNVSSKSPKGERSYIRLNVLRGKVSLILRLLESRGIKDITKVKAEQLHNLFSDMRDGKIQTHRGTPYKSTRDYVKAFKTFWHWYQKIKKKKGVLIEDVTEDLDMRGEKPKFVYFTKEDFDKMLENATHDLKPILALAFDSGVRVTELFNIKVSDFMKDFKELSIRDETSKTFGRRIKMMMCSQQVKEYVQRMKLKADDYFCNKSPVMVNREIRKLGKRFLSPEQTRYKNLTLYDFRHSSACFWVPRYKSESALKYRFGWKKSDMIHYYTEFLGMKDTINDDDMYVDVTKTELEKRISRLTKDSKSMWGMLEKQALINKILLDAINDNPQIALDVKKKIKELFARHNLNLKL